MIIDKNIPNRFRQCIIASIAVDFNLNNLLWYNNTNGLSLNEQWSELLSYPICVWPMIKLYSRPVQNESLWELYPVLGTLCFNRLDDYYLQYCRLSNGLKLLTYDALLSGNGKRSSNCLKTVRGCRYSKLKW